MFGYSSEFGLTDDGCVINCRLRNVMFEISQADDDVGKFAVNAKVLGVNMDKVEIVFQVSGPKKYHSHQYKID